MASAPGETEPAAQPADVGVDREAGEVEGHAAHDVGGLAAHARQGDEIVQSGRHLSVEALDQRLRHAHQAA